MRGQNAALGRISHYKKDPRLLEGDDYALSLFLVIFAETSFFRSFDFGACTFAQNDVSASHPTVYFLLPTSYFLINCGTPLYLAMACMMLPISHSFSLRRRRRRDTNTSMSISQS